MHVIAWSCVDHMVSCMELRGSLMKLDPGICRESLELRLIFFRKKLCSYWMLNSPIYEFSVTRNLQEMYKNSFVVNSHSPGLRISQPSFCENNLVTVSLEHFRPEFPVFKSDNRRKHVSDV